MELTPTILDIDGRLLEAYERKTQASEDKLSELNLNNGEDVLANIGVAQIPEFVILQAQNIARNNSKIWSLSRVNQALVIKSLFIDAPQADRLDFEIISEGVKIFDFYVNRSQTPYEFPAAPLPPNVSIKVIARSDINFLRIALQ
ncbi:MAG: hypothetical protein AB4038_04215, partial [Prochloraceae cyanobacterium]